MRLLPDRSTHPRRYAVAVTALVLLAAPLALAVFALGGLVAGGAGLVHLLLAVWERCE
jgi:hypothetical protein